MGNVSKDFSADIMKKARLYEFVFDFSIDHDITNVADILDIHKYLMVKNNLKYCLDVSNKCSLGYWDFVAL